MTDDHQPAANLISAHDLARLAGVSQKTIKLLSITGTIPPFVGYDKAHRALFKLDDPKLQAWMATIKAATKRPNE